jgi:hypothetical protein
VRVRYGTLNCNANLSNMEPAIVELAVRLPGAEAELTRQPDRLACPTPETTSALLVQVIVLHEMRTRGI